MPQLNINQNQLAELLATSGDEFIAKVYRLLLNRGPDLPGLQHYSLRMRSGLAKEDVLVQIAKSKEAKKNAIHVPGLTGFIIKHQCRGIVRAATRKIGLLPHLPRFNPELDAAPTDTKASKVLAHYQEDGQEIFDDSVLQNDQFDPVWYLSQNPDVATSGLPPELHYLKYGKAEGRNPRFDRDWYLSEYPDVAAAGVDPEQHFQKHGRLEGRYPVFNEYWYTNKYPEAKSKDLTPFDHYLKVGKKIGFNPGYNQYANNKNNYLKWIAEFDDLSEQACEELRNRQLNFAKKPLISIVMPVYNSNINWLNEAINSVLNQIYPNWELCIADDASTIADVKNLLEAYRVKDERIKVVYRSINGHISLASNSALELVEGEWVALLDHDDVLSKNALYWVVDAINKNNDAKLIYSDEDKVDENNIRSGPYFKCEWNRDLFYSHNMISHLGVYKTTLIKSISGFRLGMEGAQDYDLALRSIEKISEHEIVHIPRILYHWRIHDQSTAKSSDAKPYAMLAGERALNHHFKRININAAAELIGYGYRVKYSLPADLPLVSIIIPTRNSLALLRQCVESILKKTTYKNYEIIIIDNGSDDDETLQYLSTVSYEGKVRVIRDDGPFNYSALNNNAVKFAKGHVIGLLNNDVEVITPDWLDEMVSHALRPCVGAVGARLWYSNNTLQHGGVILGLGGVVAHSHRGLDKNNPGYCGRASLIQSFSAVTAACLVVRKSLYIQVCGLNEIDLTVAYNDVDFCLKLIEAGYKNIWSPYAELYHHESATRGADDTNEKIARFELEKNYIRKRWGLMLEKDPAYSPNLTLGAEDFSLAWPPRV